MLKKLKLTNRGFTIIEVLIVLAIAALILLIVFLAVPALQRNSRNTSRKDEAARIGAAVSNYVSNNNGTLPTGGNWVAGTAQGAAILSDVGTLSQYAGLAPATGAMAGTKFTLATGAVGTPTIAVSAKDAVELVTGAECAPTPGSTQAAANNRSMALLYTLEPGSGATNFVIACQNI